MSFYLLPDGYVDAAFVIRPRLGTHTGFFLGSSHREFQIRKAACLFRRQYERCCYRRSFGNFRQHRQVHAEFFADLLWNHGSLTATSAPACGRLQPQRSQPHAPFAHAVGGLHFSMRGLSAHDLLDTPFPKPGAGLGQDAG